MQNKRVVTTASALLLGFGAFAANALAAVSSGPLSPQFFDSRDMATGPSDALEPALFTGSMQYSMPIEVPAGAHGVAPAIALGYSSARGRSEAGVGWALTLPVIARSTRYGADATLSWSASAAIYELNGEELTRSTALTDRYGCSGHLYTKAQSRFEQVIYCDASDYWTVSTKDGVTRTFGKLSSNSKIKNPAATKTFEWHLEEVIEAHGLAWRLNYAAKSATTPPDLTSIQWTLINGAAIGGASAQREIDFVWAARTDITSDARYGFEVIHNKRLQSISVTLGGVRIRKYSLMYDSRFSADSASSMLASVQLLGVTDSDTTPATTFNYQSSVTTPGFSSTSPIATGVKGAYVLQPGNGFSETIEDSFDFNADGFPDQISAPWVTHASVWTVTLGHAAGTIVTTQQSPIRESMVDPGYPGNRSGAVTKDTLDINGDGRPDIVSMFGATTVLANTGTDFIAYGWSEPAGLDPRATNAVREYTYATVRVANSYYDRNSLVSDLVDINGDGCPDRVFIAPISRDWIYQRNLACAEGGVIAHGFGAATTIWAAATGAPPYLGLTEQLAGSANGSGFAGNPVNVRAQFADLNNDGIPDFVDLLALKVYLGTGSAFAEESLTSFMVDLNTRSLGNVSQLDDFGVFSSLVDMNGDGRLDFVISGASQAYWNCVDANRNSNYCSACSGSGSTFVWSVYLNTGNGFKTSNTSWPASTGFPDGFFQAQQMNACSPQTDFGSTRVQDVTGDGLADFSKNGWSYVSLSTRHPELLTGIASPLGAVTTITYAPMTGAIDGGGLPHPAWVVASVVSKDVLNSVPGVPNQPVTYTKTFSYANSFYDHAMRRFRGFQVVKEVRTDNLGTNSGAKGTRIEHWFAVGGFVNGAPHSVTIPLGKSVTGGSCYESLYDGQFFGLELGTRTGGNWKGDDIDILHEEWRTYGFAPGQTGIVVVNTRTIDWEPAHRASKLRTWNGTWDANGSLTSATENGETGVASTCTLDLAVGADEVSVQVSTAQSQSANLYLFAPYDSKTCADASCAQILREQRAYFDNLSLGSVTTGDLTKSETWVAYGQEAPVWAATNIVHDAWGNVTQVTDPEGGSLSIGFTASKAFPSSASTTIARGKQTALTLSSSTTWDERFGTPTLSLNANSRRLSVTIDNLGRITQRRSSPPDNPNGADVKLADIEYSLGGSGPSGDLNFVHVFAYSASPGPGSFHESYSYLDGFGRVVETKARSEKTIYVGFPPLPVPRWEASFLRYNYFGSSEISSLPFFTDSYGFSSEILTPAVPGTPIRYAQYEPLGRMSLSRLEAADGTASNTVQTSYSMWDANLIDSKGYPKLYRHDGRGRLVLAEEGDGGMTVASASYLYDRVSNLLQLQDPMGNTTNMQYDSRGLLRATLSPDLSNCAGGPGNCPRLFSYDLDGRLVLRSDAKGQQTALSVDEMGRVYSRHFSGPGVTEPDAVFGYDVGANALGRLSSESRGSGNSVTSTFDNWGRVVSITQTIADSVATTGMSYDFFGEPLTITYPTGEVATYQYNQRGLQSSLTFAGRTIVSSAAYDELGRPTQELWGNSLATDFSWNTGSNQRLLEISIHPASQQTPARLKLDYTGYDPNGNPTAVSDAANGWSRSYTYDWANRLTGATHTEGATTNWAWNYDLGGNLIFNSDWVVGTSGDGSYSYGASAGPHAVTHIGGAASTYSLSYDPNGSLVSETLGNTYSYNVDGRVAAAGDSGTTPNPNDTFTYAPGGMRRVRKTWTSATGNAEDLRDFGLQLEFRDGASVKQLRYLFFNGERVAMAATGASSPIYYLHADQLGSLSLVTDTAGNVVQRSVYAPFGAVFERFGADPGVRYGFTGQEEDTEIGQIHLGVREYNAATGRFGVPDVIASMGSQGGNLFSYANNRPTLLSDPSGFLPWAGGGAAGLGDAGYEAGLPEADQTMDVVAGSEGDSGNEAGAAEHQQNVADMMNWAANDAGGGTTQAYKIRGAAAAIPGAALGGGTAAAAGGTAAGGTAAEGAAIIGEITISSSIPAAPAGAAIVAETTPVWVTAAPFVAAFGLGYLIEIYIVDPILDRREAAEQKNDTESQKKQNEQLDRAIRDAEKILGRTISRNRKDGDMEKIHSEITGHGYDHDELVDAIVGRLQK